MFTTDQQAEDNQGTIEDNTVLIFKPSNENSCANLYLNITCN